MSFQLLGYMPQMMKMSVKIKIYVFRGHKVMLDSDLAELYRVEKKRINEQLRRNLNRFPKNFMVTLTIQEFEILNSQNATSGWEGRRSAHSNP